MKLLLLTPQGTQEINEVTAVTLPTSKGEITVLENHEPLVAQLASGAIEVQKGREKEYFASFDGFAQVSANTVKVFSAGTQEASTLDEAKIQEAIKQAQALKESHVDDVEFARAAALLERELAKLKALRRRKRL